MQVITPLFEIASRISTPLALSGFVLAVLFFIFRQILAKNIFPKLSGVVGGALLGQIVDRLFVLALAAMILGFIGFFGPLLLPRPPVKQLPSSTSAESFLNLLYGGKYRDAYDSLAPSLRNSIPFVAFVDQARMTMSQFSAPPVYRHLTNAQTAAGQYYLTFEAEFDEKSRFREIVTYADTGDGWMLLRFDIYPADWPLPTLAKLLSQSTAGAMFEKLRSLRSTERNSFLTEDVIGHWIPLPGWSGRVQTILSKKGTRTCDVQFTESTSGASLVAKDVLDGCSLKPDQKITLLGKVESAGDRVAELSSIRYFLRI